MKNASQQKITAQTAEKWQEKKINGLRLYYQSSEKKG